MTACIQGILRLALCLQSLDILAYLLYSCSAATLRLKQFFPFTLIDAMGTLEETRQQITNELRSAVNNLGWCLSVAEVNAMGLLLAPSKRRCWTAAVAVIVIVTV